MAGREVSEVSVELSTAPEPLCECGCGNPVARVGRFAERCYRRWRALGRPDVLPPPMPRGRQPKPPEPVLLDAYDITWGAHQRAQQAVTPEQRAERAKHQAAALIACVAASDAEGIRLLLHKLCRAYGEAEDWFAFSVVLAECADPGRAAIVTGQQRGERGSRAA